MNKIFKKLTRLNTPSRELKPRIKGAGKQFDKLFALAAEKGLELYASTDTATYYLWLNGNSIEGTYDGFNTLGDVAHFLKTYTKS